MPCGRSFAEKAPLGWPNWLRIKGIFSVNDTPASAISATRSESFYSLIILNSWLQLIATES
jgi:hypothetical protein